MHDFFKMSLGKTVIVLVVILLISWCLHLVEGELLRSRVEVE